MNPPVTVCFPAQPHALGRLPNVVESLVQIASGLAAAGPVAPTGTSARCAFGGPQVVRGAELAMATGWAVAAPDAVVMTLGPGGAVELELAAGVPPGPDELGRVTLQSTAWRRLEPVLSPVAGLLEALEPDAVVLAAHRVIVPAYRLAEGQVQLSRLLVQPGQEVAAGEPLARWEAPLGGWPTVTVTAELPPGWRLERRSAPDPQRLDHRGVIYLGAAAAAGEVLAALVDPLGEPRPLAAPPGGPWQVLAREVTPQRLELLLLAVRDAFASS